MTESHFEVNIPSEVKDWLAEETAENMRSQTAEIILALKEKMRSRTRTKEADSEAIGQEVITVRVG